MPNTHTQKHFFFCHAAGLATGARDAWFNDRLDSSLKPKKCKQWNAKFNHSTQQKQKQKQQQQHTSTSYNREHDNNKTEQQKLSC